MSGIRIIVVAPCFQVIDGSSELEIYNIKEVSEEVTVTASARATEVNLINIW